MTRALVASLCIALAVLAGSPTQAEQPSSPKAGAPASPPASSPNQPAAASPTPAPPQAAPPNQPATATSTLAVPPPEVLLVLIRTTLVALNQAVSTGNFTVLRDLGSPAFQAANSPAQLGVIFAGLRNRNIDLSPVVVVTPEVSEPPQITQDQMLRLVGRFPTKPLQVQFQLLFQPVNGQWRLFGMAVDAVAAPAAAAAAATPPAPSPAAKAATPQDKKDKK